MSREKFIPFLKKLKSNNNKEWFDKNRPDYSVLREELITTIDELTKKLGKVDKAIETIDPRKSIFRINRDIRFSNNKSPYKTNMGAYISAGGKKSPNAGYYLHIEPGNCFLAGGMWHPEADILKKVRQEIDYNGKAFTKILAAKNFKGIFGSLRDEDKLVRVPKDYDAEHPLAEFLKLKSFIAVHPFDDKILNDKKMIDYCVQVFKELYPLNSFLNAAIA
jgi:uncharacterized protein (TIGR02453 family)